MKKADLGLAASDIVQITVKANAFAFSNDSGAQKNVTCFINSTPDQLNNWFVIGGVLLALLVLACSMHRNR